jgi:hypothetical protein
MPTARGTMELQFEGDQVIVVIAKGVLVMSREAFIAALKQGADGTTADDPQKGAGGMLVREDGARPSLSAAINGFAP